MRVEMDKFTWIELRRSTNDYTRIWTRFCAYCRSSESLRQRCFMDSRWDYRWLAAYWRCDERWDSGYEC
nr:MAG TPA: hypothetical protein [Caudoviricetes sp.]